LARLNSACCKDVSICLTEATDEIKDEQFRKQHPEAHFLEDLPFIGGWFKETGISRDNTVMAIVKVAMLIAGISVLIGFLYSSDIFQS
jgi:hypothetical protein